MQDSGGIAGVVEIANIALENGISSLMNRPAVQITAMLVVFAMWAATGARTARDLHHLRPGITAAVMSAGVCMVIAVTAGFALELFIAAACPECDCDLAGVSAQRLAGCACVRDRQYALFRIHAPMDGAGDCADCGDPGCVSGSTDVFYAERRAWQVRLPSG